MALTDIFTSKELVVGGTLVALLILARFDGGTERWVFIFAFFLFFSLLEFFLSWVYSFRFLSFFPFSVKHRPNVLSKK